MKRYEILSNLYAAGGNLAYSLAVFGDHLAVREGYSAHTDIDAVHFYLVHKFSWLPGQVRSMNNEDLRFILAEEMQGWTMPKEAVSAMENAREARAPSAS